MKLSKQQLKTSTRHYIKKCAGAVCTSKLHESSRNSMTPHRRNTSLFRSSQQLPRLRLEPLKGFLSRHGAFQGTSTRLVRCFRNYKDTVTGVLC